MRIQEKDLPIVKAFLEREAMDYGNKVMQVFANFLLSKIEEGLAQYEGKANYLIINSHSNMGFVNRSVMLTPNPWAFEGNVVVELCTCGKPECWGEIIFPNHTRVGKKGMEPL